MMSTTELDLLRGGRDYLADPEHFTTGTLYDRSRSCAWGALVRQVGLHNHVVRTARERLDAVAARLYPWPASSQYGITWVNDYLGQEAVLRCYDAAIAELEEFEGVAAPEPVEEVVAA